jgi:hypothetical protein
VIALIGNRPVIQVGRHQVSCYDSQWLRDALCRAMHAADRDDFPFVDEICQGIFHYLENKCPLRLLPLPALYEKMRRMLEHIGCENIAQQLRPLAPPVQVSLLRLLRENDCTFELALFPMLHREIDELCSAGANEIRFLQVRECTMELRGTQKFDKHCQRLQHEIKQFLQAYDPRSHMTQSSTLILHLCEGKSNTVPFK